MVSSACPWISRVWIAVAVVVPNRAVSKAEVGAAAAALAARLAGVHIACDWLCIAKRRVGIVIIAC